MESGMIWLGIVLGCLGGFLIAGWFSREHPPMETLFVRLLHLESRSTRTDTRLLLHELHRKVEDLTAKMQRMDAEIQDLLSGAAEKTPAPPGSFVVELEDKKSSVTLARSMEVSNLTREGLSPDEIARRLNLGRGEIELMLSLGRKPFWVIGDDKEKPWG